MRYALIAGLYGVLLSVMNTFNAQLADVYGNWASPVMIHLVGLTALVPFALTRWGRRLERARWYQYLGGIIGILTVVFVNVAVIQIGVTLNLVLMLLGQVTCSALVDQFGLLGAKVTRINRLKAAAMAVMAAGCAAMLALAGEGVSGAPGAVALAIILSFLSGYTMVLARIANASLAQRAGVGYSTVMNYITGLCGSLALFALTGFRMAAAFPAPRQPVSIYLGGALGALGIFLCNVATPRLPALQMSVIVFVGQVFSGMALDALMGKFSLGTLLGGLMVAAGLYLNTQADAKEANARGTANQS